MASDREWIESVLVDWAKGTEPNMPPMFYGTGSHKGDLEVIKKVNSILEKLDTHID